MAAMEKVYDDLIIINLYLHNHVFIFLNKKNIRIFEQNVVIPAIVR